MKRLEEIKASNNLIYKDNFLLSSVKNTLSALPALVDYREIMQLHQCLIKTHQKQAFIIQMGDCAERFSDAHPEITRLKYEQLIFFKSLIEKMLQTQVIVIGRLAGQYAKPRSNPMEWIAGKPHYAYHGDMINAETMAGESRLPDPHRILQAYHASRQILSDLAQCEEKFFTSHECLLLEYEEPLTRFTQEDLQYNLSTHLPWLGMRNIESKAHIHYLSTIHNPVAIKISDRVSVASIVSVIQKINPQNDIGKIVLITRLGVQHVKDVLPQMIQAIQEHQLNVIWMCDPLHGNTYQDPYGKKFRVLQHMVNETIDAFKILNQYGIHLGGVHLEVSYQTDILECVDSLDELTEQRVYESAVDPRLNHEQCLRYFEQVLRLMKV